jgi:hypothetical protein
LSDPLGDLHRNGSCQPCQGLYCAGSSGINGVVGLTADAGVDLAVIEAGATADTLQITHLKREKELTESFHLQAPFSD